MRRQELESRQSSVKMQSPRQRKKKDKLITNIKGQASDKMRLNARLNNAVDDLIKMGQKY